MNSQSLSTIDEEIDVLKPQQHSGRILSTKTADACLDWVVFPALLFIQFGATMFCQMKQGRLMLDWKVVHTTIFLFCIVAGVYRQVLRKHQWESLLLLLLPEIFTNILLAMVMFGSLVVAYEALVMLTFMLFVVGIIAAAHISLQDRSGVSEDYQRLRAGSAEDDSDEGEEWIC